MKKQDYWNSIFECIKYMENKDYYYIEKVIHKDFISIRMNSKNGYSGQSEPYGRYSNVFPFLKEGKTYTINKIKELANKGEQTTLF